MAIYSLRISAVGKSTQNQPFTAAAHIKYITRKEAVTHVMAARMPDVRRQAIAWIKREERFDRKNARVVDKLVLALPRELSGKSHHLLVKAFADVLTQGRASWFAAFHTAGKDVDNPHCHLVLRDRDTDTGKRVMLLSAGKKEQAQRAAKGQAQPTTLRDVRALWELCVNEALACAGRAERVDHRSLKDQGIRRAPQVHEGPNIRAMHQRGFRPRSRDRLARARPWRRGQRRRVIRWADIDRGRTRVEYNEALRAEAKLAAAVAKDRAASNVSARLQVRQAQVPEYFPQRPRQEAAAPSPVAPTAPRKPRPDRSADRPSPAPSATPANVPPTILPPVAEPINVRPMAQETGTIDDRVAQARSAYQAERQALVAAARQAFADADDAVGRLIDHADEFGPADVREKLLGPSQPFGRLVGSAASRMPDVAQDAEVRLARLLDLHDKLDLLIADREKRLGHDPARGQVVALDGHDMTVDPERGQARAPSPVPAPQKALTMTERFAQQTGASQAKPNPTRDRTRDR